MNVDDLDLPPGLLNTANHQNLGEQSVRNIQNVNIGSYINSWLEDSTIRPVEVPEAPDVKVSPTIQVFRKESRFRTNPDSTSSTSSCSSRQAGGSQEREQMYPAGYTKSNIPRNKESSKISSSSKNQSENCSEVLNKQTKDKACNEAEVVIPGNKDVSIQDVLEAMKSQNPPEIDSEWKDIFDREKVAETKSDSSSHNEKFQRHMKQAVNMCLCKECLREPPDELEYEEIEKFKVAQAPEQKRPPPLLKTDSSLISTVMTAPVVKEQGLAQGILDFNKLAILTHGHTVPRPQNEIQRTNLIPAVQRQLAKDGFDRSKPVQSFGWPAIMRGNNVVMIHKPQTGKTLTYIPAVCSFLMDQEDRYDRMPDSNHSPVLIVLANNSTVAEDVYMKLMSMLKGNKLQNSTWCPQLPLDHKHIAQLFKKNEVNSDKRKKHKGKSNESVKLEILVTTVDTLIVLLHARLIDLKRLRHFVVENLDIVLDKLQHRFELLLGAVDSMLSHRNCYDGVQFICTAEKWSKHLEKFVIRLDNFPLIIIGNHMQAALYGRANFLLQYVEKTLKIVKLIEFFKDQSYKLNKAIVVCKMEEINHLQTHFARSGIAFVAITDNMGASQVAELLVSWATTPCGGHIVLLCTDKALRQNGKVSNATLLVNYSLPPTWSLFSQRFSTLIDSYVCPLTSTASQNQVLCQVVTYVDEKCMNRFPRISNFFTTNGFHVPDVLQQYCKAEQKKAELEKVASSTELCKLLLNFGSCNNFGCKDRHIFSNTLETAFNSPANGRITCRLVNMRSINHYFLQILEYKDIEGKTHKVPDHAAAVTKCLDQSTGYEISPNAVKGKMYLYAEKREFYRCVIKRVVQYVSVGDTMTNEPLDVEIFGLDNGNKAVVNVNKLCTIPEELENIPSSVVEVYIAKLIPPFKESLWTKTANRALWLKLKSFNSSSICIGNILLRLNDTIWVDDLQFRETNVPFPDSLSVTQFLKGKHLYDMSEEYLINLYGLCKDAEVQLPEYKVLEEVKQRRKLTQPEANWAHLRPDELHAVYFSAATSSDCVYVRHAKFDSLLKNLEENIASSERILRKKLNKADIIEGFHYCLTDKHSGNWCRVLLEEVKDDIAKCFYVDYGDYAFRPVDDLRLLANEYFSRLPFQSIQCSLYGIESTSSGELVDALYEESFEPNTDYFKQLYAMPMSHVNIGASGRKNYKIMLLDYYSGEGCSINRMLLGKNLAQQHLEESLENVQLPENKAIPDVCNSQFEMEDQGSQMPDDDTHFSNNEVEELNSDDFDFYFPGVKLYDDLDINPTKVKAKDSVKEKSSLEPKSGFVPMKVGKSTNNDNLLPRIKWYQDAMHVFLEFIFAENKDYVITMRRGLLSFSSKYKDKNYVFKIWLYKSVKSKFVHESKTHFIAVTLTKGEELEWPRLAISEEKMLNVVYKVDKIAIDEDSEEDESTNYIQSKEIDSKYFQHAVVTAEGNIEEYFSDYDDLEQEDDFNED